MTAAAGRKDDRRRARCRRRGASAARSCSGSPSPTSPASSTSPGSAAPSPTSPPPSSRPALEVADARGRGATAAPLSTRLLVVGMGRLGGGEMGYGQRRRRAVRARARSRGPTRRRPRSRRLEVVQELRRLLGRRRPRPAARASTPTCGPRARTARWCAACASYRAYYERWSLTWESQALLRAAPVAGDARARRRGSSPLIDPLRWPEDGPHRPRRSARSARSRPGWRPSGCPAAPTPRRHFKLGPRRPVRRRVDRAAAPDAARPRRAGAAHHDAPCRPCEAAAAGRADRSRRTPRPCGAAWTLASRLRNAAVLCRGRPVDSVPIGPARRRRGQPDPRWGAGHRAQSLPRTYRRLARRARTVTRVQLLRFHLGRYGRRHGRQAGATSVGGALVSPSCLPGSGVPACLRWPPRSRPGATTSPASPWRRWSSSGPGSALATAATFAVSLVPCSSGAALLSPFADRMPYRTCLIVSHLHPRRPGRRAHRSRSARAGRSWPAAGAARSSSSSSAARR